MEDYILSGMVSTSFFWSTYLAISVSVTRRNILQYNTTTKNKPTVLRNSTPPVI